MEIMAGDGFSKSLKRMIWHQHPIYKFYEFFRYKLPHFFKNIWLFRKELYSHRWWDYRFTLDMLERSLIIMEKGLREKGIEVDESRNPKVKSIQRVLELLKNNRESNFIDRAEQELGELVRTDWEWEETGEVVDNPLGEKNEKLYKLVDKESDEEKEHNRKIFERVKEMEDVEWNEIWDIIKGTEFSRKYDKDYDGSDMRSWWD